MVEPPAKRTRVPDLNRPAEANMESEAGLSHLSHLGAVISVRGSVVDIRFDAHLPPIYSLLHAKVGDVVIWKRPAGDLELEILSITYPG